MNKEEKSKKKSEIEEYQEVLRAVQRGDKKAKAKLARFKLSGDGGVEVDKDGAVSLLNECVEEWDMEAMWMLGLCYEYGMGGCKQDLEKAEDLYKQSCEGGSVIGEFFAENGNDTRGSGVMIVECLS